MKSPIVNGPARIGFTRLQAVDSCSDHGISIQNQTIHDVLCRYELRAHGAYFSITVHDALQMAPCIRCCAQLEVIAYIWVKTAQQNSHKKKTTDD